MLHPDTGQPLQQLQGKEHDDMVEWYQQAKQKYTDEQLNQYLLPNKLYIKESKVYKIQEVKDQLLDVAQSPSNAKEFFSNMYLMAHYPHIFFSKIHESGTLKGLRMLSFSLLVSITIGALFYIGLHMSNLILIIPASIQIFFSLRANAVILALFFLIFVILQPLYYVAIRLHHEKTSFKYFFSASLYAFSPFALFWTIPILNITSLLWSLKTMNSALHIFTRISERSVFMIATIYTLSLAIISLILALFITQAPMLQFQESVCELADSNKCTAKAQSWNSIQLTLDSEQFVQLYDKTGIQRCSGSSNNIVCNGPIPAIPLYFNTSSTAGYLYLT